jgi:predicted ArsR family transcriptional regulator
VDHVQADSAKAISELAALDQPLRRQLYHVLVEHSDWVGRDEAADAVGVARSVAAFHLDRLAAAGLAEVRYERPLGRGGPGAGRPAKKYRRSRQEIAVSVPPRSYDLAAAVLADALEAALSSGTPVDLALRQAARRAGIEIGARMDQDPTVPAAPADALSAIAVTLTALGYEPYLDEGVIIMANCPFLRLAERQQELVCGMNLDLINGLMEAAGLGGAITARIEPTEGNCCVRLKSE